MAKQDLPTEFIRRLKAITAKRARTVIDHILEHGHITTEELNTEYGYDHPPRAARDVREQGIPLETFRMKGAHGRMIGAYRFGNPSEIKAGKLGGRIAWPKDFKDQLIAVHGKCCGVCLAEYESRYLQIDHRVPYEVAGDDSTNDLLVEDFMLVCGSCNRGKSWSCEHCSNWTDVQNPSVCESCYWARPQEFSHVATRQIRRLDLTWSENEVVEYENIAQQSQDDGLTLQVFIKKVLRGHLGRS